MNNEKLARKIRSIRINNNYIFHNGNSADIFLPSNYGYKMSQANTRREETKSASGSAAYDPLPQG
jgi:hypothetical protein